VIADDSRTRVESDRVVAQNLGESGNAER